MRQTAVFALVAALAAAGYFGCFGPGTTQAGKKGSTMISHDVYFTLKDKSPDSAHKLIDGCRKYLTKHPGEVFFAVGTRTPELKRDVNDQEFDVALHIVFEDLASQDKYQEAERHQQFIKENKALWTKVRVFDSTVTH